MSDFRCPYYYWDGSQWRCTKTDDYLNLHDFDRSEERRVGKECL